MFNQIILVLINPSMLLPSIHDHMRVCECRVRSELLILCGYIGGLLAIRRQYSSIVPALYEYTRWI